MAGTGTDHDLRGALSTGTQDPIERPKLLYLGAGGDRSNPAPHLFPDFEVIGLDNDPDCKPDIELDMTRLETLPAGSFDGVVSSHSLEHVHAHEVPAVLAGVRHVLKRAGQVFIRVPDLQKAARLLAEHDFDAVVYMSPAGPVRALDMIYGYRPAVAAGKTGMAHRTGFTPASLRRALEDAGFIRIEIDTGPVMTVDLIAIAMRP
jgi:SAM-dependent methyltransferase